MEIYEKLFRTFVGILLIKGLVNDMLFTVYICIVSGIALKCIFRSIVVENRFLKGCN